jgi:hypothetical protein
VNELNGDCRFADGRGDAFDRTPPGVTDNEHTGLAAREDHE